MAVGLVGCDVASTLPPDDPIPLATSCAGNVGPALPSLGACCTAPHYVGGTEPGGQLLRWERFPLVVAVDTASFSIAPDLRQVYLDAIMDGLELWPAATGGLIGRATVRFGRMDADIRIQLGTYTAGDECGNLSCSGLFDPDSVAFGRVLRRGTVFLYPQGNSFGARPPREALARLVGHEMGHALGLLFHSEVAGDLMTPNPMAGPSTPYPWVSTRDLNTMMTAYCR